MNCRTSPYPCSGEEGSCGPGGPPRSIVVAARAARGDSGSPTAIHAPAIPARNRRASARYMPGCDGPRGSPGRTASARSYQVIASSHRPCRASVIPTLSRASDSTGSSRSDDSSHSTASSNSPRSDSATPRFIWVSGEAGFSPVPACRKLRRLPGAALFPQGIPQVIQHAEVIRGLGQRPPIERLGFSHPALLPDGCAQVVELPPAWPGQVRTTSRR